MKIPKIKNSKALIYLFSVIALICVFLLYWFISGSFLRLSITPKTAVLTIDNAPVRISGLGTVNKRLKPGSHLIRVDQDGYIGFNEQVNLKGGSIQTIKINLKSNPKALSAGGLLAKGNDLADGYYLGNNGKTIYHAVVGLDNKGDIQSIENREITQPKLNGITDIIWSPDKSLALFRKSDGIYLYDFKKDDFVNQTEQLFGKNIGSIAWAPDNSKIAYFYSPPSGEKTLVFANITNSTIERVYNFAGTGIENPILHWSSDSQWLLISPQSKNYSLNNIYVFNAYSRTMKKLTDNGNQVDGTFSPDNKSIVYATYSATPTEPIPFVLSIMSIDGSNKKSLDVRADIRNSIWFKDSSDLLLVSHDTQTNRDMMFKFNVNTKQRSFGISSNTNSKIDSMVLVNDDQIILYQSNNQIFGINAGIFN